MAIGPETSIADRMRRFHPCYDRLVKDAAGYILVGGRSSRLGRDKALLELDGQPIVLRLAGVLEPLTDKVTLVGQPEKYAHLGLPVVPDPVEGFGPVAGLLAALGESSSRWNLIVACDLPLLTSEFLKFLLRRAKHSGHDITLPLGPGGLPEPLCGVYSRDCRDQFDHAVRSGIHKVTRAFGGLSVGYVTPSEYASFDPSGRLLTNLNSPEDLGKVAGRPQDAGP